MSPQATEIELRKRKTIQFRDKNIQVHHSEHDSVTIETRAIQRVSMKPVDWNLVSLSALLLLFGGYFAYTTHVLGGLLFIVLGSWSLYRTYQNRYAVYIWTDGKAGPITIYPVAPKRCHSLLTSLIQQK